MIVVQDLDKNFIGSYTTIKSFLRECSGLGAKIGSYDYIRKRLRAADMEAKEYGTDPDPLKYKGFLLTRSKPVAGINKKKKV